MGSFSLLPQSKTGAAELADATLYLRRDAETGERKVLPPQKRLVEMLEAFERHMKVRDVSTYKVAIKRINNHLTEGVVEGAVVTPAPGERWDIPVQLSMAPSLMEARELLSKLIENLRESYRPGLRPA